MILECPHCNARLNAATAPAPGSPVRCSKCKQVFQPVPPEEIPPEPAASSDDSDWSNVALSPVAAKQPEKKPVRKAVPSSKKFPILAVGGGVVTIIALVVVIVVFAFPDKSKPTAPSANTGMPPKKDNPSKKDTKTDSQATGKPQIPAEFAELFKESADHAAPVSQVPILKRVGAEDLTVPSFPTKNVPDPEAGKLTLEELKKASAFMKVASSDGTKGGTGSGFVIKSDSNGVLVATNFHVVSLKSMEHVLPKTRIGVVFDSGLPTQIMKKGEVVAMDPDVDLAIVKVDPFQPLPKAIDAGTVPKLVETMNIRSFGFPLGEQLGINGQNPNVTVGTGTVSSVRLNKDGSVSLVQINGASLNPGNSGGPVVDSDGRLVGIVVSGIQGSGIANAIPAAKLGALLTGHVFAPIISTADEEDGQLSFQVEVPVSDPLKKIKEVNLYLGLNEKVPPSEPDPSGSWKVMKGATKIPLSMTTRGATGGFNVPTSTQDKKQNVVLQLEAISEAGPTAVSAPVQYRVALDSVQTARDTITLDKFRQNLGMHNGQVVAVRGKVSPTVLRKGAIYELQVTDGSNTSPAGLLFLTDREVATQLSELTEKETGKEVRLTLRVGKQAINGTTPLRIGRIDFIGPNNRLEKSIPSSEDPADKLVALNRKPEKFVGQTVTFPGLLSPVILGTEKSPELSIMSLSEKRPENICFISPPSIISQLKGPGYSNENFYPAQFTVRVEPRVQDGSGAQIITVTKIELADTDGKPGKTLE